MGDSPFRYNTEKLNMIPIEEVLMMYGGIDAKIGKNFKCISGKHTDSNPSMSVHPKKNYCHCFSCNETFSTIDAVEALTGKSFGEACKTLINDFGLSLEEYSNILELNEEERLARENGDEKDVFPLTPKEVKMIGIKDVTVNENFPSFRMIWSKSDDGRQWADGLMKAYVGDRIEESKEREKAYLKKIDEYENMPSLTRRIYLETLKEVRKEIAEQKGVLNKTNYELALGYVEMKDCYIKVGAERDFRKELEEIEEKIDASIERFARKQEKKKEQKKEREKKNRIKWSR